MQISVADREATELAEKGFLTSSCCPAFVDFIKKQFPAMVEHISHNLSPMGAIAEYIKKGDPTAKVVYLLGRVQQKRWKSSKSVLNRLWIVQLLLKSCRRCSTVRIWILRRWRKMSWIMRPILAGYLRVAVVFADAVQQALKEHGEKDFVLKALPCDGIEACRTALFKGIQGDFTGELY